MHDQRAAQRDFHQRADAEEEDPRQDSPRISYGCDSADAMQTNIDPAENQSAGQTFTVYDPLNKVGASCWQIRKPANFVPAGTCFEASWHDDSQQWEIDEFGACCEQGSGSAGSEAASKAGSAGSAGSGGSAGTSPPAQPCVIPPCPSGACPIWEELADGSGWVLFCPRTSASHGSSSSSATSGCTTVTFPNRVNVFGTTFKTFTAAGTYNGDTMYSCSGWWLWYTGIYGYNGVPASRWIVTDGEPTGDGSNPLASSIEDYSNSSAIDGTWAASTTPHCS